MGGGDRSEGLRWPPGFGGGWPFAVAPSVCAAVWTVRGPLQGQVAKRSAAAVSRWGAASFAGLKARLSATRPCSPWQPPPP